MKSIIPLFLFLFSAFIINAQNQLIAVGSGDNTFFTTNFQSAINAANPGDTIYLNGGIHNAPANANGFVINKELHIIGVGHYPDSTTVTGISEIYGILTFAEGSDNSTIKGIYFSGVSSSSGNIKIGTSATTTNVSNISIERCNLSNLFLAHSSGATTTDAMNIIIRENVIRRLLRGAYATNLTIENNHISDLAYFTLTIFKNNHLRANHSWTGITQCSFQNNVLGNNTTNLGGSNEFFNNIFTMNETTFNGTSATNGGGNIFQQSYVSIHVNSSSTDFDYASDYHLAPNHPGINAGNDGTDIGLYGGPRPWKSFSVPCNPHLVSKNVVHDTDANGNLNVQFNVTAQDN